jgi:HEAT repeats
MKWTAAILLLALTLGAQTGCSAPPSAGGFDSPDPAAKLYAIRRAGKERNRAAIPDLVQQLQSDDPAVRMFAIAALEKITGQRLGYNPYAPPDERDGAVEKWVQAVREGRFGK